MNGESSTALKTTAMQQQKLTGEGYMNQKPQKRTPENSARSGRKQSKYLMTHFPSNPNHNLAEEARVQQFIDQYYQQRSQAPVSPATASFPKPIPFNPVPVGGLTPQPPIRK